VALRDAIEAGDVLGPRMRCAGAYVTCPGGGGDLTGLAVDVDSVIPRELRFGVTSGVDQMRSNVRNILRYGADFIKIIATGAVLTSGTNPGAPEFTEDELRAAVEETALSGTYVAAHAHGAEGIKRAVRAGVRSIEHGTFLDEEAAGLMAERGTWLVPTITSGDTTEELANDEKLAPEIRAKFKDLGRPEFDAMKLAAQAGLKVAMGTDAAVMPHGWNLNELAHMANNGFTPAQTLHAATLSAAELMGWEDRLGSLEPGKVADVVVVEGDPFAFETLKDRIEQVWKDGIRVV
jgi:imidazolonepropionase-like amidohydrolase